ncbi:hypothetical protein [Rubripirellula reticaptiva]|uniref:BON domain-containing protein n=1 Tax=Rubripirellula reticaptiva TaxID=2528013 RepID=A0A5C6EFE0_9BACT|nr:hypothetical protein [Rubripirellula reticaptiva]TWU46747.1 hypothetical protein Poly59_57200 [Rubripirellula reticaptiva]
MSEPIDRETQPTNGGDSISDPDISLCEKIVAALRRNDLMDVHCSMDEKGPCLTGHVNSWEERSIAFAIARTTAGTTDLTTKIEVRPNTSDAEES